MDIDQLRTFLAVVEHGNFSRAGAALGVGQSTVSFHVHALETAAGARLFDRRGRRARPTAAGRVLLRYAQKLVALRDQALAELRAEESGASGALHIAASTIPAEYLLPPVLAQFRRAHPQVAVAIDVFDSRGAVAALLAEACDFAVVGAARRDARVVYSPFAEDELVLAQSAAKPFVPSRRLEPDELARLPLVVREEGSGSRAAVAALLSRRAAAPDAAAPIQVGSTEAVRRSVLAGVGLGFISRRAIAEDLAAHRLQLVKLHGTPVHRRFSIARLKRASPPAAARAFQTALQQFYR